MGLPQAPADGPFLGSLYEPKKGVYLLESCHGFVLCVFADFGLFCLNTRSCLRLYLVSFDTLRHKILNRSIMVTFHKDARIFTDF